MLMNILQFLGGLVLLLVGGRLLVSASIDTARRLNISPLIVGLTLVAWGTSAPELALNVISAIKGRSELAVGNVVGANICNMALVLGFSALLRPLLVEARLIRVELWVNAVLLTGVALAGIIFGFTTFVGVVLLLVFAVYSAGTIFAALSQSRRERPGGVYATAAELAAERQAHKQAQAEMMDPGHTNPDHPAAPMSWLLIAACFVGGLTLLSIGGSLASDGASGLAIGMGIPAAVVGVTVVSIGTTLPELVTSILAVRRGQTDLAMGNAVGSCLFNAGAILGLSTVLAQPPFLPAMTVPLIIMGGLGALLIPISRTFGRTVSRAEGALLLAIYVGFLVWMGISVR